MSVIKEECLYLRDLSRVCVWISINSIKIRLSLCLMLKKVNEECKLVHPCIPILQKVPLCVICDSYRVSIEISFLSVSLAITMG